MSSNQFAGLRRHPRTEVQNSHVGSVVFEGKLSNIQLVNFSESGLCVESEDEIPEDQIVDVRIDVRVFAAKCVWKYPLEDSDGKFRYGLTRSDEGVNLLEFIDS